MPQTVALKYQEIKKQKITGKPKILQRHSCCKSVDYFRVATYRHFSVIKNLIGKDNFRI